MQRPVRFTVLGDWSPVGYIDQFVWIAFPERLVATGERHGPDNHAGIWRADEFLERWSSRLTERGWQWMIPVIDRLAKGDDPAEVESVALWEYLLLHDAAPLVQTWDIDPDAFRRP